MEKKLVTLKDVAEKSGVSMASVSIILNKTGNYKKMSAQTRRRVEKIADEIGYQPNYIAKALRNRKTMQIGIVLPNVLNHFTAPLIMGSGEVIKQDGYNYLLFDMTNQTDQQIRDAMHFIQRSGTVDGLLVHGLGDTLADVITDIPVVYLDSHSLTPSVCFTETESTYQLTNLLIQQGLTDIVFASSNYVRETFTLRENGYRKALLDAGLPVSETSIGHFSMNLAGGVDAFKWLMSRKKMPHAIISTTDSLVYGLMLKLIANGVKIPQDIAVASVDDLEMSSIFVPPITCSHIDVKEMGSQAAKMLMRIIQKQELEDSRILIPTYMIVRESSKKFIK